MRFSEQGTVGSDRYTVVPRSLSLILCDDALLLLRGAPTKRIWANRLNGLGGHIEPGENPRQSALREIREEAGLDPELLELRGVVHISGHEGHPGVMLFVFVGHVEERVTRTSPEGTLEWHALDALPWDEMVADLPHLVPRVLDSSQAAPLFGRYTVDASGEMRFEFESPKLA
jgi:8-oxo-dGTP diphosphatase